MTELEQINNEEKQRQQQLIENMYFSREKLLEKLLDPRRDIGTECGHPANISREQYKALYDREPIAARVVEVEVRESWASSPEIVEDESAEVTTQFEQAWQNLCRSLRGQSWYNAQEGNPVWEHLRRADELSGIGAFGVILLGIDDGKELQEPIDEVEKIAQSANSVTNLTKTSHKLLFLRSFDESLVDITRYEQDPKDPRYGQPTMYRITFNDPHDRETATGAGLPIANTEVHWTRVIHLADNLGSSEIFGRPRMRPVFNRLLDLLKLYGGSAEMYWRGAFPGFSIETHPQLGGDVQIDREAVRKEMSSYTNGLQRYMAMMGMGVKSLAPQVVDPTAQINVQIDAICIKLAIPRRIFVGSERGELASSQDEGTWNGRLKDRQDKYITPRIIVPFIDRLILIGVLPEPQDGYSVQWPSIEALAETEKATIATQKTQALATYVSGNVEALIQPIDYLVTVLGYTQEQAQSMLESVEQRSPEDEFIQDPTEQAEEELIEELEEPVENVFCPTGEGGGIDATCSPKNIKLTTEQKKAKSDQAFAELQKTRTPADQEAHAKARADGVAIPPAWTQVVYHGKDKDVFAEGRDSKGRKQRAENPAYRQRLSDENNARIEKELLPKMDKIRKQLRQDAISGNEESKVLYLISQTGFRIGGEGDGKAKEKAFGASTLQGEHIRVEGDTVHFHFKGKKGVEQKHSITDPIIAKMMENTQSGKPVFNTKDRKVREAWQNKYGGTKVHDIRHVVATEIAARELAKRIPPIPKTKTERTKLIKDVGSIAAAKLGNDTAQAIGTYISPSVWKDLAT